MYFHIMIGAGSYTTSTTTIPSKRVRDGLVFRYSGTGDIVDDGTGNVHLNHMEKIMALEHTCPCVPTSPTSKDPKTGLHHCNTQSDPVLFIVWSVLEVTRATTGPSITYRQPSIHKDFVGSFGIRHF